MKYVILRGYYPEPGKSPMVEECARFQDRDLAVKTRRWLDTTQAFQIFWTLERQKSGKFKCLERMNTGAMTLLDWMRHLPGF